MIDGNIKGIESYGTGAVIALLAIVMVFIVLIVIIVLTDLASKVIGNDDEKETTKEIVTNSIPSSALNIDDEDATIACLIAAIDYRNEVKKNIQVIGVREVK